jgi:hypothetical protein
MACQLRVKKAIERASFKENTMTDLPVPSAKVGSKVLFENERVRVWDLCLAPGESTGLHAHRCDYFYVVIGDGELEAINADGSVLHRGTMQDGEVHYRSIDDGPAVHEAFNVGKKPWRNIIIELKDKPR